MRGRRQGTAIAYRIRAGLQTADCFWMAKCISMPLAITRLDISGPRTVQFLTMAARATWKGFLKISLVNIPIKVFPATESRGTISFHQLHRECQTRIQQKRWCPYHNREVPNSEIVKGYEFEKGRYVVLSGEDFDKVRPESTRVIDRRWID
jgi:hypothetical protein